MPACCPRGSRPCRTRQACTRATNTEGEKRGKEKEDASIETWTQRPRGAGPDPPPPPTPQNPHGGPLSKGMVKVNTTITGQNTPSPNNNNTHRIQAEIFKNLRRACACVHACGLTNEPRSSHLQQGVDQVDKVVLHERKGLARQPLQDQARRLHHLFFWGGGLRGGVHQHGPFATAF